LRLESVRLENYACFRDITVEFNPGFNVVVGINGSGKTSLLRGICDCLVHFVNGTHQSRRTKCPNPRVEIQAHGGIYRFEEQYPVSVAVKAWLPNEKVTKVGELAWRTRSLHGGLKGDFPRLHSFLDKMDMPEPWPLIASYDAAKTRRMPSGKNGHAVDAALEKTSRKDAYIECLSAKSVIGDLERWVVSKRLERLESFAETGRLLDDEKNADDELALVNNAIALAIRGAKGLSYGAKQKSVLMVWDGPDGESDKVLVFDRLSDGERALVTLVADIARRVCILNPHLGRDVFRRTPGVILIDEVDLHLHPQWQRRLPSALKEAFPLMQFIVTTHSPPILSELASSEIILLKDNAAMRPDASYGLNADRILEEIMETPSRPQKVKEDLLELFRTIEAGLLHESKRLLAELTKAVPDISEIASANALIRRKEVIGR
jgi:predicted ATP-binding protein involved in virulence